MAFTGAWLFDWGTVTQSELSALAASNYQIDSEIASGKTAAISMINSGSFGATTARYRVFVRGDGNVPAGYTVEIRYFSAT